MSVSDAQTCVERVEAVRGEAAVHLLLHHFNGADQIVAEARVNLLRSVVQLHRTLGPVVRLRAAGEAAKSRVLAHITRERSLAGQKLLATVDVGVRKTSLLAKL